jgi:hypothetical protein
MPLLIVLLLSGVPAQRVAADPDWWNTAWSCRKAITVTESSGSALTDYQVKIDLIHEDDMQPDFGDLRFTNASDTPLDYWLESKMDSDSATVWVKVDAIAASTTTTIYMYYGNATATSTSDGVDTFDWFDDFEDGSISGSYTKTGYDGWSEAGGVLTFTTGGTTLSDPNVLIIDNKTYGWGYEIRGKIRVRQWQNHDYSRMGLGLRTEGGDGYGYKGLFHWRSGNKTRAILHNWVSWLTESNFNWSLDTWYWIGFYAELGGSTRYLYEKDWLVGDAEPGWLLTTSSTSTTHQDGQPCISGSSIPGGGFSTQFIGDWDDVLVRKRVDPEPTYSVGGEECLPTVDIAVSSTLINEADDGGIFDVMATFSKAMNTGITPIISFDPDIVTSGTLIFASGGWSIGDTVYTASYDIADVDEEVTNVDVSVGGAEDVAGNRQNPDPTTEVDLFDVDTVAPTVDITATATDPTNISPIPMTATFSEDTSGFMLGEITVGNGTAGNLAGSGPVYTFDVTPVADGLVTVDIAAGVAQDAAGNDNTAATQFAIAYDSTGQMGGTTKDKYYTNDDIRVTASGFLPDSDVDVYVVRDYHWNDGDDIPPVPGDPVFAHVLLTADGSGDITNQVVWVHPIEIGEYDVVFDAGGDGFYDELWDLIDDPNHPGFIVVKHTVGGEVYPVDKAALLMPWLGLALLLILATGGLILTRRAGRLR